jgi:pimeloyl-ACP methyl ester carboxylesterase
MKRGKLYFSTILFLMMLAGVACDAAGQSPASPTAPGPPLLATTTLITGPAAATAWYIPTFEEAACQFAVPTGYQPTCGYLTIPERRDKPGESRMIRLHVAVFHCAGGAACKPDAVVHLTGGPGGHGLALIPYMFENGAAAVLQSRDYVFFDQRGVGTSEPALDCLDDEDAETCHNRFLSEGIDLSAYNSAASAADIQDLRTALGYDQVNLLGVSYGTRLALTTLRDHPEGIRSAILDSAYPPQANLYITWSASAERSFNAVFAACAADPACNAAYPDLEIVFFQVIDQLNASPVTADVQDEDEVIPFQVNGDLFMDTVFNSLYRADIIPIIPQMIFQVRDGDHSLLATRLVVYLGGGSSLGMNYSVQCYEEIPFSTWDDVLTGTQALEHPQTAYFSTRFEYFYQLCSTWNTASPAAVENQPVSSPVPVLILAGQYDPIAPPEWGDLAAQTLPGSYVFHFPHTGHWVLRSGPCGWEIAMAFLDNPTQRPDGQCIASIVPLAFP